MKFSPSILGVKNHPLPLIFGWKVQHPFQSITFPGTLCQEEVKVWASFTLGFQLKKTGGGISTLGKKGIVKALWEWESLLTNKCVGMYPP